MIIFCRYQLPRLFAQPFGRAPSRSSGVHVARGRDKYHSDEIPARIRHILMHEWDPIGVPGLPVDEYDRYIATILLMLLDAPRIISESPTICSASPLSAWAFPTVPPEGKGAAAPLRR
jgi:hypothetical protein